MPKQSIEFHVQYIGDRDKSIVLEPKVFVDGVEVDCNKELLILPMGAVGQVVMPVEKESGE